MSETVDTGESPLSIDNAIKSEPQLETPEKPKSSRVASSTKKSAPRRSAATTGKPSSSSKKASSASKAKSTENSAPTPTDNFVDTSPQAESTESTVSADQVETRKTPRTTRTATSRTKAKAESPDEKKAVTDKTVIPAEVLESGTAPEGNVQEEQADKPKSIKKPSSRPRSRSGSSKKTSPLGTQQPELQPDHQSAQQDSSAPSLPLETLAVQHEESLPIPAPSVAAQVEQGDTALAGTSPVSEASTPELNNLEITVPNDVEVVESFTPAPGTDQASTENVDALTTEEAAPVDSEDKPSRNRSRRSRGQRGRKKAALESSASDGKEVREEESIAENDEGATLESERQPEPARSKERPRNKRKMFVSVLPGEQVEVAIAEEGALREYYVEMLHQAKIKGNIYKGIIHNVDANLQAAFVSYGAVKNGFLQIDEVHPDYYLSPHEAGKGHKYPLIQKVLRPGQEILVQVVKEPSGSKGAFLTSYVSIPGRFLVLTPGREQIGVSRKVENDDERFRLKEMLSGLEPGPGLGVIVRTVSMGASKSSLQRDLLSLKKIWRDVRQKATAGAAPCLVYQEMDLAARAVRDYLTEDVTELWVDDDAVASQLEGVAEALFPKRQGMVQLHKDPEQSLFTRFGLKRQLDQVHGREVVLPSGGRLVFDHTEALTAIDINSGRTAGKTNFEDMAFKINLEAAQHIPLQLRLRDIGGQVVIDFIEMRDRNHWREVEKAVRNGMKEDRARHDVGKISSFGLLEIVRQRLGSSAISITSEPCPHCKGTGQRRNLEWQALQALRDIQRLARHSAGSSDMTAVLYSTNPELLLYLLNNKKERLLDMEKLFGVKIELRPDHSVRY